MIVLDLPIPPSVNSLFTNVSPKQRAIAKARGINLPGRVKTREYKKWLRDAGWMVLAARQTPIEGAVRVAYTLPDKGAYDLGNVEKATSDLLVKHGLIEDDSREFIREITMRWSSSVEGCRVTVEPWGGA